MGIGYRLVNRINKYIYNEQSEYSFFEILATFSIGLFLMVPAVAIANAGSWLDEHIKVKKTN